MPHSLISATLLAFAGPALVAGDVGIDLPGDLPGDMGGQVTTMTFHERVIVRVPRPGPPPPQIVWKEKHGPKCIAAHDLAGAMVSAPGVVDLILAGDRWMRAKLDRGCAPLDVYSGFYLKPGPDGRICADRDVIRARSGTSCGIEAFNALKPIRVKR